MRRRFSKILSFLILSLTISAAVHADSFMSCSINSSVHASSSDEINWDAICDSIPQADWGKCADMLLTEMKRIDPVFSSAALEIRVVNQMDVNAYLYGNRTIVLPQGLLNRLRTRSELAFILGHELGHFIINNAQRPFVALSGYEFGDEVVADFYGYWLTTYFSHFLTNPLDLFDEVISGDQKATLNNQFGLAQRRKNLAILAAYDRKNYKHSSN